MSAQPSWWAMIDEAPGDGHSSSEASPAPPSLAPPPQPPAVLSRDGAWFWDGAVWHELSLPAPTEPVCFVLKVRPQSRLRGWAVMVGLLMALGAVVTIALVLYGGSLSGWQVR